MKIILLPFLLYYLMWHYKFFLQRIFIIIISLFYLLEYWFIFLLRKDMIYFFLLYLYNIKENFYFSKKVKDVYVISDYRKKKYNKSNNYNYKNKILTVYYNRRMHVGFLIVYIQIFLRKVKEFKNYVIHLYIYTLKRNYNNSKKKIINYSLFFYFKNYKLVFFLENLKRKILNFIFYFNYIKFYSKIKIKNKLYYNLFFILIYQLLLQLIRKIKLSK